MSLLNNIKKPVKVQLLLSKISSTLRMIILLSLLIRMHFLKRKYMAFLLKSFPAYSHTLKIHTVALNVG